MEKMSFLYQAITVMKGCKIAVGCLLGEAVVPASRCLIRPREAVQIGITV